MKKFLDLSVTSRKNVSAEIYLSAEALSHNNKKLGQFDVKVLNSTDNGGIFIKYTPSENCDSKALFSSVHLTGKNDAKIKEVLTSVKDLALKNSFDSSIISGIFDKSPVLGFLFYACINPEAKSVKIPDLLTNLFNINITNEFIVSYLGDQWIGIETKCAPKIQDKIQEFSDSKKRKTEEEKLTLLKNLASILS